MKSKELGSGHRRLGLVAGLALTGWVLLGGAWQAGSGLGLGLGLGLLLTALVQFILYARR